ncbi:MAG: DedA family protein [Parascardovia denticolens]
MQVIHFFVNLLKDPRTAIAGWITTLGLGPTYAIIFLIIFIETGVVFFPFLPGDSLLFAAGYFAADPKYPITIGALLPIVWLAPILGDECNYFIGRFFGRRIVESGKVKSMTPERIAKTEGMIDRWGPLAVFLGRFFPFIRTFMPFFAGITGMKWRRFAPFSILGGLTWSSIFTLLGYFFGGIPTVQRHFELVIVGILLISLIPTFVGLIKAKTNSSKRKTAAQAVANDSEAAEEAEATAASDIA